MQEALTLFYAGSPGQGYGWGTANTHLIKELSRLCNLQTGCKSLADLLIGKVSGSVFVPLIDHDFNPVAEIRGDHNFAYTFFEYELGPNAAANAAKYDVVFCGSSWCLERMKERGITNGRVLIQGVDHDIFKPYGPLRTDKEFRLFSGGKFEYRKGQDIVIAAFRELAPKYPDMRLVCAWFNPWPQLIGSMAQSPHIKLPTEQFHDQQSFFHRLFEANGIDPDRVSILGHLTQPELADAMNLTDLGVFPNRCEGGTNLVLMEYMACGKPTVATWATGHKDVLRFDVFNDCAFDYNGWWAEPDVEDVAGCIEDAVQNQSDYRQMGQRAHDLVQQWTWERAARTVVETIKEVTLSQC